MVRLASVQWCCSVCGPRQPGGRVAGSVISMISMAVLANRIESTGWSGSSVFPAGADRRSGDVVGQRGLAWFP